MSQFTDAKTWYPGIEIRGNGSIFYRDFDASVVVPSKGNQPYTTRVVDADGSPLPDLYGLDLGSNGVLGTGNPGDEGCRTTPSSGAGGEEREHVGEDPHRAADPLAIAPIRSRRLRSDRRVTVVT